MIKVNIIMGTQKHILITVSARDKNNVCNISKVAKIIKNIAENGFIATRPGKTLLRIALFMTHPYNAKEEIIRIRILVTFVRILNISIISVCLS